MPLPTARYRARRQRYYAGYRAEDENGSCPPSTRFLVPDGLRCMEHLAGVGPGGQERVVDQHVGVAEGGAVLVGARTSANGAIGSGGVDALS